MGRRKKLAEREPTDMWQNEIEDILDNDIEDSEVIVAEVLPSATALVEDKDCSDCDLVQEEIRQGPRPDTIVNVTVGPRSRIVERGVSYGPGETFTATLKRARQLGANVVWAETE